MTVIRTETTVAIRWFYGDVLTPRRLCALTPCWNMSHTPCADPTFPVYIFDSDSQPHGDIIPNYAPLFRIAPPAVRLVTDPAQACVTFVISPGGEWPLAGPNVLLVGANGWHHSDRPGVQFPLDVGAWHAGMAIRAHIREEYQPEVDVMMPAVQPHFFDNVTGAASTQYSSGHGERPLLVAFRGSVFSMPMPWYGMRDRLSQIHRPEDGIVVETTCDAVGSTEGFGELMRRTQLDRKSVV